MLAATPGYTMSPKVAFFYYLGAFICFVVATLGETWRYGGRTRAGLAPRLVLVPLGLALFVLPTLWATFRQGF